MDKPPLAVDPTLGTHRWPWRLSVGFVLLTLLSLAVLPWFVQRRVSGLRAEIVAAEPARTLVLRWQINLVREMAALSELVLTGDSDHAADYTAAWSAERSIADSLPTLAARLSPEVSARVAEARERAGQWHARIRDDELRRLRATGMQPAQIPRGQAAFDRAFDAVIAVDSAIVRATAQKRAQIRRAERTGLALTVGLGLLALAASATVIALEARARRYAMEIERQRAETAEALAESARAADARARLLRGITHDVKNPLGAAKGYAELLAMGIKAPVAPGQVPLVAGIERSVDNALAIIADLLDLARMDSGVVQIERVEVDLNVLAREAVEDYRAAAGNSGHILESEAPGTPVVVHTDPHRVRQVLDNLLSNAIKYTPPPGRITVRVDTARGEVGARAGAWATIQVIDTGPGIPRDQREAVFDEFTRLDEGSRMKGHGLGLAIARGHARRLGGDLTIADTDAGATFVLWLPQREQPSAA